MTSTVTDRQYNDYVRSHENKSILGELLTHSNENVRKAQEALATAERARRIDAVIAVRAKYGKVTVASALGISRVTLDKWIADVESDPEQLADVERFEYIVRTRVVAKRV